MYGLFQRAAAALCALLMSMLLLVACTATIQDKPAALLEPALAPREQATLAALGHNPAVLRPLPGSPLQSTGVAGQSTAVAQPTSVEATGAAGERLFVNLGCIGCHRFEAGAVGPSLQGVYGSTVQLANGETVTADEAYIRNSIINPKAQIVAGYPEVMPSYQNRVSEEELTQLVAYIQSLAPQAQGRGNE